MIRSLAATALLCTAAPLASAEPTPVTPGYQPADEDERGLWMQVEEAERKLKASNFLIRDPALNDYVRSVFCRTVGEACRDVRIYITRTPYFNASMAPNGMMQIWSGLFLRVRDEAQLAAVLGHEYAHYRERHSIRLFRDVKDKTNAMAWLSMIPVGGLAVAGAMTVAQFGIMGSIFGFSREMERDADTGSVAYLAAAGYDPAAASRIWAQLLAEEKATEAERKRKRSGQGGLFATHPGIEDRMADLAKLAAGATVNGPVSVNRDEYRAALAPYWADFIDDQIKLNDFGATELLLASLAEDGWTADLLYARGELYRSRGAGDDFVKAAGFYREATLASGTPPEAWRGLGLSLMRSGDRAGGQDALRTYLDKRPDAKDRAMMAMLAGV